MTRSLCLPDDVRVKLKNGHVSFHEHPWGMRIVTYDNLELFQNNLIELTDVEIQWAKKEKQ